jgi:hypothetical protein
LGSQFALPHIATLPFFCEERFVSGHARNSCRFPFNLSLGFIQKWGKTLRKTPKEEQHFTDFNDFTVETPKRAPCQNADSIIP